MSEKVKLQHYVPRGYLQNFTIGGRRNYLYCFDKMHSQRFITNVKNIASETYFYDTTHDISQKIEKFLDFVESHFKSVCDKLIEREDLDCLNEYEKHWLSHFLAIQLIRTKKHRELLRFWINQVSLFLPDDIDIASKDTVEKFKQRLKASETEEGRKLLQIRRLRHIPEMVSVISQKRWILLVNETSTPYWCSDEPVFPSNVTLPTLLSWSGIQLQIPLSPKISLWVCDPTAHRTSKSKYAITDSEKITFQNILQVYGSARYLFSNHDDFSIAAKLIADNPSLANVRQEIHDSIDRNSKLFLSHLLLFETDKYSNPWLF